MTDVERALELEVNEVEAEEAIIEESEVNREAFEFGTHWETHLELDLDNNGSSSLKEAPIDHQATHPSCVHEIDESLLPYIGQDFLDKEAAYQFNNKYARVIGFSVRKSRVERSPKRMELDGEGVILSREFVCSREGHKQVDKNVGVKEQSRHDEVRIGCPASFQVRAIHGVWVVDRFVK
ncbi:protein FAR1-RELATED SEQUENCE 5-like [Telopea speciosissima]|uniref:protein FAR1-RELATED SEQUENCE 5-like n=1 Tax=Telopea speciosissima TaxID=54955 RepID=UPI001CC54B36|nr:protein FAR1-RELATED SEQUENCE 5-like [Telopea speciosissima]